MSTTSPRRNTARTQQRRRSLPEREFKRRLQIFSALGSFLGALGPTVTLLIFLMQGCQEKSNRAELTIEIVPAGTPAPSPVDLRPLRIEDMQGEQLVTDFFISSSEAGELSELVLANRSIRFTATASGSEYLLLLPNASFTATMAAIPEEGDPFILRTPYDLEREKSLTAPSGRREIKFKAAGGPPPDRRDPILRSFPVFLGLLALTLALAAFFRAGAQRMFLALYDRDQAIAGNDR